MERQEIIKKSFAMFRQYGVKSVSMDDIAAKLHVSKKTLYDNFNNKEELIQAGVERVFNRMFEEYDDIYRNLNKDPLVAVSLIYHGILKELSRYESAYFYTINKYANKATEEIEKNRAILINKYIMPLMLKAEKMQYLTPNLNLSLFIDLHLLRIESLYNYAIDLSPRPTLNVIFTQLIIYPISGICSHSNIHNYRARLDIELEKKAIK